MTHTRTSTKTAKTKQSYKTIVKQCLRKTRKRSKIAANIIIKSQCNELLRMEPIAQVTDLLADVVLRAFSQLLVSIGISKHVDPNTVLGVKPADHELGTLILQGRNLENAGCSEQGLDIGLRKRNPGCVGIV